MQDLSCLIVEDEPLAAELLADYIQQVPGLRLEGICGDIFSASENMRQKTIDLVFLDINLPGANGLELIRSNLRPCQFILTTAYHQHAVEGFNLNVVDYLLKPFEFSRFLQAVHKVYDRMGKVAKVPSKSEMTIPDEECSAPEFHFFKVDKKMVKVTTSDIQYIESLKDYIRLHLGKTSLVTKQAIGEMEGMLGAENFLRIHKSYVVNIGKIKAFGATSVEVGEKSLPIGRTYRKVVEKRLRNWSQSSG